MKSQYTVELTQVDNGIVVRAGCMTLVYTDSRNLITDLEVWFREPHVVEKMMTERYLGKQEDRVELRDEAGAIRSGYEAEGPRETGQGVGMGSSLRRDR